ncbi:PREDICTED: F-box only protein 13 [Ipomoea nil]|uniref:F-box only protein 13 n=1 Tax=Ipomoea nil TaxID=35883 RepID=UPI000900EA16|nr:PREDICTED: F-box only protein 13 [Ipomoea nil]
MERGGDMGSRRNLKRKFQEYETPIFGLDELNQDLLERVLSRLPASSFFRLSSVCKRWKSVADSATFRLACSDVPSREPWFYMVGSHQPPHCRRPVVYDSSEENWKVLGCPSFLRPEPENEDSCCNFVPVAASGGLLCFHSESDGFVVSNPVTGFHRRVPSPESEQSPLQAIAMASATNSYKLVLVSGEFPKLSFRVYDSGKNEWGEKTFLRRKDPSDGNSNSIEDLDDYPLYFLSKCGNLVASELQRSPCKQYSSVISSNSGEETVYFLSPSGTVVACNLAGKWFVEYPRLLPLDHEYSIDLVECRGEVYAVALSDYLESASLRVWRFDDEKTWEWEQVSAMPPALSHEFYGKAVDINCAGAGNRIFVCASCSEFCRYFLCNLEGNEWVELPNGNGNEFSCAFSFEPRIEAST